MRPSGAGIRRDLSPEKRNNNKKASSKVADISEAYETNDLKEGDHSAAPQDVKVRVASKDSKRSKEELDEGDEEDVDVVDERRRVLSTVVDDREDAEAIRVLDVHKTYRDGKKAVRGVTFGVEKGLCFGLLGPNGAGKTSIINTMTGGQAMTEGNIELCGIDLADDIRGVHSILGVCPQFDCVWEDLTIREHLLMYATIKGMGGKRKNIIIRNVAEMVGLDGDPYNKNAGELSGGMRRRLSIAIALVTNPSVLVLDEPTTGLDPDTRNGLWTVINAAAKARAVLLTTHSMEEADALCGRIGIMVNGRLKCLGTPLHLKNKFGEGYVLSVSLDMNIIKKEIVKSRPHLKNYLMGKVVDMDESDLANKEKLQADKAEGDTELGSLIAYYEVKIFEFILELLTGQDCVTKILPKKSTVANICLYSIAPPERDVSKNVDHSRTIRLSIVFERMEQCRIARTLPVQEWSVGKTTLDEVFLEIVNRYGGVTGGSAAITNAQAEGAKTASAVLSKGTPSTATAPAPAESTTATDNEGVVAANAGASGVGADPKNSKKSSKESLEMEAGLASSSLEEGRETTNAVDQNV